MDNPISRAEHEEFVRRMDDEHKRINHRITLVEDKTDTLAKLTASVESIAESVKTLTTKVAELEKKPAENWNTVVKAALTAIGSALGGGLIALIATQMIGG
jgi:uncharacterized protein YoxC